MVTSVLSEETADLLDLIHETLAKMTRVTYVNEIKQQCGLTSGREPLDPWLNGRAYRILSARIHQLQQERNISGIEWAVVTFRGIRSVPFPRLHRHLIPTQEDLWQLASYKPIVLSYWLAITGGIDRFRVYSLRSDPCTLTRTSVVDLAQQSLWLELESIEELPLECCLRLFPDSSIVGQRPVWMNAVATLRPSL